MYSFIYFFSSQYFRWHYKYVRSVLSVLNILSNQKIFDTSNANIVCLKQNYIYIEFQISFIFSFSYWLCCQVVIKIQRYLSGMLINRYLELVLNFFFLLNKSSLKITMNHNKRSITFISAWLFQKKSLRHQIIWIYLQILLIIRHMVQLFMEVYQ